MAVPTISSAKKSGNAVGKLVAYGTGTTSGSANTLSAVAHGALDVTGAAYGASDLRCLAVATVTANPVYVNAAPDATNIDVRSPGTSIAYIWFVFAVV